jgi:endoglucanase
MPRIGYRLLGAAFALMLLTAADEPPAVLSRGINITHWFRFPPSRDPMALRGYFGDAALARLKRAGFTFVRLPVQPDLLAAPGALTDAVARIQRHGLAVVVSLFATARPLETDPAARANLLATWRDLARVLRPFDAAMTFPEVLNEPVFANDPGAWAALQHQAVAVIRATLPTSTIVLTGPDWGSIEGLLSLPPEPDRNVVYGFHFYQPAELTALGAFRPGLDAAAMSRLPFPVLDRNDCQAAAAPVRDRPTADLVHFYCMQQWGVAKVTARIALAAAWGRGHHVAVLAGEFGASERLNAPARVSWLAAVREACENAGIGWALWGYDDSMGLALHPPDDHRPVDPALMRSLGLIATGNREAMPRHPPIATAP